MATIDVPAANSPLAREALQDGLRALQDALRCPDLEGALPGPLPPAFLAAMRRWWAAYDRYLAVVTASLPVSCQAGCSACCQDNPRGVSGVELLWLWRALPSELRGAAQEPGRRFEQEVARLGVQGAHEANRARSEPCMYLGRVGLCSVYRDRPVACRMFVALSPPERCRPEHPLFEERVNPHLEPPAVIKQLLLAISERLGLGGLPRDLRRGMAAIEDRLGPP